MEATQQVAVIAVPLQEWNETKKMISTLCDRVAKLTNKEESELLTPKEVCEMLKIGRTTFQRYVANGILTPVKVNGKKYSKTYARRSEIEHLINTGQV